MSTRPKEPDQSPYERFIYTLEQAGCESDALGKKWGCPAHVDPNPSLSVDEGDDGRVLLKCFAGCEAASIVKALDLKMSDLFPPNGKRSVWAKGDPVATYEYENRPLSRKHRFEANGKKTFTWEHRENGEWVPGLPKDAGGKTADPGLYRQRKIKRTATRGKDTIYVVEGEKKVLHLEDLGMVATTSPHGANANKWLDAYTEILKKAALVILIADHDDDYKGQKFMLEVARRLEAAGVPVKVIMPPKIGHDIVNHLNAGRGFDDLVPVETQTLVPVETGATDAEPDHQDHVDPDVYFDRQDGFIPAMLGSEIQGEFNIRIGPGQHLYWYADGVFLDTGEQRTRASVRRVLANRFKRRHADEVVAWLKSGLQDLADAPTDLINVRNGMLDWRTGELLPHSPEYGSMVQIPVEWNPEAECPRIDTFLGEVLPEDAQVLAREVFGYLLLPSAPMRRAFMLVGSGSNGKSKFLGLAYALVGSQNCTAISLQTFGESRFATADIYGKLANICGDLDASALRRSDTFKIITGGTDVLSGERKYGSRFEFVPFTKLLFSANEVPPSHDQSDAIFDRWVVLPFDRRFDENEGTADPHLLGKITTREELEGLLVRAVDGLRGLMERGHFALPESVQEANADYRSKVDTVAAFVDEVCEIAPDRSATKSKLYEAYQDWCHRNGRHPVSQQNLTGRVNQIYRAEIEEGLISERKARGVRRWQGIRVRWND